MTTTDTEVLSIEHLNFEPTIACTMQNENWVCPDPATHSIVPAGRCEHTGGGFTCDKHLSTVRAWIAARTPFHCQRCGFVMVLRDVVPL